MLLEMDYQTESTEDRQTPCRCYHIRQIKIAGHSIAHMQAVDEQHEHPSCSASKIESGLFMKQEKYTC